MDALYRDFILDHYKNPRNFGELDPHDLDFHDHNPLCGDELGVHIVVEDGKVKDLRFTAGLRDLAGAASITSDELIGCRSRRSRSSAPTG
jgi:nitrogen fixation NifU-like protein